MTKIGCAGLVLGMFAGLVAGAQVESPAIRLEAASALTSLDGIDEKPWHLKLDVTTIDETKVPSEGTIDVWHAGADRRTVMTFGDATSTRLRHDGKWYYSGAGGPVPNETFEVMEDFLHPGPQAAEMDGTVPELRKQKFGKSEFDCVMMTRPLRGSRLVPLGLYPTYCLSNGILRVAYSSVDEVVILNRIGTFLGHDVALDLVIRVGQVDVATAKVVTLATYTPTAHEFVPTPTMHKTSATARVAGSVIAGARRSFVPPVYPDNSKTNHVEGQVVLHAIIERDGTVHRLRPINAANPDLILAAIAAVREWTYRPYLLNGEPVQVDTTITVNFKLGF